MKEEKVGWQIAGVPVKEKEKKVSRETVSKIMTAYFKHGKAALGGKKG